jgi:FHIPEP family protein
MSPARSSVRSLRYELACALADDRNEERLREALAELDRVLDEPGDDPPDQRIHLQAGRLLERTDPGAALQRYLDALEGDAAGEPAIRARTVLAKASQPATLIASLPTETIERVADAATRTAKAGGANKRMAKGQPDEQLTLLAAALLRQTGAEDRALELLMSAHEAARSPDAGVVAELAETLLDLDRSDEALELAAREDSDERDPSLQLVRAQAHLGRGEFDVGLRLAEQSAAAGTTTPALTAVRALCLAGLGRLDEATESLPQNGEPDIDFARAVVCLQRQDTEHAREASWSLLRSRPNDTDALLINAQTIVEGLGEGSEDTTPSATIDAARQLLREIAEKLPAQGTRSRWWRAQSAIRKNDGRFAYFSCEFRLALDEDVSVEELEAVDRSRTTVLQDAVLAELIGGRLGHDRPRAAAAYDDACATFRFSQVDAIRAASTARAAYELEPTVERAAVYAGCELSASYEVSDDSADGGTRAAEGRAAAERWLDRADDDQFARLTNVIAWLRLRTAELASQSPPALLPWLLMGIAAQPDDGVLRAVVAQKLLDGDMGAASVVFALDAFDAESQDVYVVEAAIIATVNYYGEIEKSQRFLTRHVELHGDSEWRNAVELSLSLTSEREAIRAAYDLPLTDRSWAKRDRASATAFLHGLPAAREELGEALEACLADEPPSYEDAVFLAATLRRQDDVSEYLSRAQADSRTGPRDVDRAREIQRFAFEPDVAPDEFITRMLELCTSPNELYTTAGVTLPIVAAARDGVTGPVPAVRVDDELLRAFLSPLEDIRARGLKEVDRYQPRLSPFVRLADTHTGPASLELAIREATAGLLEEMPQVVLERIGRLAVERAVDDLPRRLLAARLGRDAPLSEEELSPALGRSAPARLAIAVLAPSDAGNAFDVEVHADDVAVGADEILRAASVESVAEYWHLDDLLREAEDDPAIPPAVRETAAVTREKFGFRLDELLGLTSPAEVPLVQPVLVEVGDALVPIVDSAQDGGIFLYELIPAMRERILTGTGVAVPGVRMRGAWDLPPEGFRVHIDEVPVRTGAVPLDAAFTVRAVTPGSPVPDGNVTDVHPLTGARGLWAVGEASDESGDAQTLTPAQYLLHQIEGVLRAHLPRFLGPEELDVLVSSWSEQDDEGLIAAALPDDGAKLRLTWLLQSLVADSIDIGDWRTILATADAAGGLAAPPHVVRHAVRARLRITVGDAQNGRPTVPVPPEHEAALLGRPAASPSIPRDNFMRWLQDVVIEHGPAITLVTQDEAARDVVSALARSQETVIATVSVDDLGAA